MRTYTQLECEQWLKDLQRCKPDADPSAHLVHVSYPSEPYRTYYLAHWIATELTHRMPTLLWVTEWGIWPSSENWHLYYKLRQSYGDSRLLHEAPGHFFVGHEAEDLASFLQLAMLNGWGGYVLTQAGFVNAFFSHDEFVDFYAERDENLAEVRKSFAGS
jgi:hypothetical protein